MTVMDTDPVLVNVKNQVAVLTLNRPDKRNALDDELVERLKDSLRKADENTEIRAVVITGAGTDFCSGADLTALKKISGGSISDNREDAENLMEVFRSIRRLQVPVIAAVRGRALAGGCGLATACDLVLASRSARFGYPEVRIGFVPAMVMAILRRNVSEKRAFELATLGREIGAEEAYAIGLINRVFDDESFEQEVEKFVGHFVSLSRSAVTLSKRLLYHMDGMSFENALLAGVDVNTIARMTDDCQKGIVKFLKKDRDRFSDEQ